MLQIGRALEAAVRAGSLVRYRVVLEAGELENRRLWQRPEIETLFLPPANRTCGKWRSFVPLSGAL